MLPLKSLFSTNVESSLPSDQSESCEGLLMVEETFLPLYGSLYWSATWRQPGFCPVDRAVIDVAWQVVHGVLYTADRLISFGYDYDPNCFCGSPETPSHLFFECALAQSVLGWI